MSNTVKWIVRILGVVFFLGGLVLLVSVYQNDYAANQRLQKEGVKITSSLSQVEMKSGPNRSDYCGVSYTYTVNATLYKGYDLIYDESRCRALEAARETLEVTYLPSNPTRHSLGDAPTAFDLFSIPAALTIVGLLMVGGVEVYLMITERTTQPTG